MNDFKYTIKRPNMVDSHFDSFQEATMYIEELIAEGKAYTFVDNKSAAPVTKASKIGKAKRRGVRCEASNYYLTARNFNDIIDGKCTCCGKEVKERWMGDKCFIPAHNIPE